MHAVKIGTRALARNAVVAALYAAISLILPRYRISSALYVLAAFDRTLIPGLTLGNAVSGLHHRPLDLLEGAVFGWVTAWLCSKLRPAWAPLAVAIVPTGLVTAWLTLVIGLPLVPTLINTAIGYAVAAVTGWVAAVPLGQRVLASHHHPS